MTLGSQPPRKISVCSRFLEVLAHGQSSPGKKHLTHPILAAWAELPQCFLSSGSHTVLRPVAAGHPALCPSGPKGLLSCFFLGLFPRKPGAEHGLLCFMPFHSPVRQSCL